MGSTLELTAVVVTRDRVADLTACLESLLRTARTDVEFLVVSNGATADVERAIAEFAFRDDRIRSIRLDAMSPSLARNRGADSARGALMFFLDDDVIVPDGTIDRAIALMRLRPEVGIAGGPNLTPADDPELAQLFGALLASRFGTGIARPRYAPRDAGEARESDLVLCNLVVRRALFADGLSFPRLFGGEENHLMGHAESRGVAMWYDPALAVHHRRRRTIAGHLEQVHRYGVGRANAIVTAPRTFRVAYLAPLALVLYLGSLPFTTFVGPAYLVPLAAYLGLDLIASGLVAAERRRAVYVPALVVLFPMSHVAYGIGLGTGLLRHALGGHRRPAARDAA